MSKRKYINYDTTHKAEIFKNLFFLAKTCLQIVYMYNLIFFFAIGEATAGKSTLINLLLEADILPTWNIKCTQTICEIRKSKDGRRRAFCFGVNGDKKVEIDLSTKEGKNKLATHITYEDDYGDNPFEKVEIYWLTDIIAVGVYF